MRLGIDGRELSMGVRTGIGRYATAVIEGARREGVECVVYSDQVLPTLQGLAGVTVRIVPRGPTLWWDQVRLPRRLAADRLSVFLSPYYKGPLLAPCPVVLTIHDLLFIEYLGRSRLVYDRAMTWLARLYAGRAAAIITDSEFARRTIVSRLGLSENRVTAIPLGVASEFRPVPFTEQTAQRYGVRRPYVLAVGNFLPHKNLVRLVQAFAGLPRSVRCDCQLVLAGEGAGRAEALKAEACRLGIGRQVVTTGFVAQADLPVLYAGCEAFVMPSLDEGFGLPAAEAMACGAPVIAADRGALPEVVGEAGLLVDPVRSEAIGAALAAVLSDAALRKELRRRSLARAACFRGDGFGHRVLALLRAVARS
jgi:glycosyltransferase involved in cell wall biosynthesis